jgi:hypothetical protein
MKTAPWLQNRITSAGREVARLRRELRRGKHLKDEMRLGRELKQAQVDHAYAVHWVMLT